MISRPAIDRAARLLHKVGVFDISLMASAYFFYAIVRQTASDQAVEATARAREIVSIEQSLGFFWEAQMQSWILGSEFLIKFWNSIYTYGHFPVIGVVGLWLFIFHRERYVVIRNAFLLSGAISLVVFHLYPLAPPRLLPAHYGFVDTLSLFSDVNYHSAGDFVNQFAAMPSLHVGWIFLAAVAVFTTAKNPVFRAAAGLMPVLMSVAVVVTGNHYFLDIAGGVIVALMGLFLAVQLDRHGDRMRQAIFGQPEEAHPSLV